MIIGLEESFRIAHLMPKWNLDLFLPDDSSTPVYVRDNSRQYAAIFKMNEDVNFFTRNKHTGMPYLMPYAWAVLQWAVTEAPFVEEMSTWWVKYTVEMAMTPKSNAFKAQVSWMSKTYDLATAYDMFKEKALEEE